MAKRIYGSTPKQDGFRMPGEFEPQAHVFMVWPQRTDNWRQGAKPAQRAFTEVAKAIAKHTNVTMLVNNDQYANARARLPEHIRVVEASSDDAWVRDSGPTFVINDKGEIRGVDWIFNAWGGLKDGLYFPWANDDAMAQKICDLQDIDSYRTDADSCPAGLDFILEGGSIHVDGEGTLITTEMCLLNPESGRNFPELDREQIERMLKEYLNLEKIIWIKDGIDPYETNGHIDDVACYVRPGEVACIWTDDPEHPFYAPARAAYETLSNATDAKGRKLKVHKLCMTKKPCYLKDADSIDIATGAIPRAEGEISIASYMNFLITNNAIILPQYGDENDALAVEQIKEIFPGYAVEPVLTTEVAYGGGNIHCITQQQPRVQG